MTTTAQAPVSATAESQDLVAQDYIVQSGDDLAKIAEFYLGSQEHWDKIHQDNLAQIGPNPHELEVGMVLSILPIT